MMRSRASTLMPDKMLFARAGGMLASMRATSAGLRKSRRSIAVLVSSAATFRARESDSLTTATPERMNECA